MTRIWHAVRWWGWAWLLLVPMAAIGTAPLGWHVAHSLTVWAVLCASAIIFFVWLPWRDASRP
jgi:hypothetical protein